MRKVRSNDGWVKLKGPFVVTDLQALAKSGHVDKLSITEQPLLTVELARGFATLRSVTRLWLWCDVTRAAMRYVYRGT